MIYITVYTIDKYILFLLEYHSLLFVDKAAQLSVITPSDILKGILTLKKRVDSFLTINIPQHYKLD